MEDGADAFREIRELKFDCGGREITAVLQEIGRMERRIFPKHESLVSSLETEVKKKNSGLFYAVYRQGASDGKPDSGAKETLSSPEVLVAGYVMYSFTSSMVATITKLGVRESCRKQGYGESLLKAAIGKCRTRPVHRVSLHVDPKRAAAMGLYKKLGFKTDALVHSYYAPHRDAYRMFLDFETS